jgi:hypothetical protein
VVVGLEVMVFFERVREQVKSMAFKQVKPKRLNDCHRLLLGVVRKLVHIAILRQTTTTEASKPHRTKKKHPIDVDLS